MKREKFLLLATVLIVLTVGPVEADVNSEGVRVLQAVKVGSPSSATVNVPVREFPSVPPVPFVSVLAEVPALVVPVDAVSYEGSVVRNLTAAAELVSLVVTVAGGDVIPASSNVYQPSQLDVA